MQGLFQWLPERCQQLTAKGGKAHSVYANINQGCPRTSVSPTYAAAAAAKSFQSCPTLCYPIDGSPPGSPVPGILQARTLEWVAISFTNA